MLAVIILCILVTWLVCGAVCIGIGGLLLRGLGLAFGALDALWTGVGLIAAMLQMYHFFRPIDLVAGYGLVGLGLAGWIWNGAPLFRCLFERREPRWPAVLLYIPAATIVAFRAAALGYHYDTGLYGAQAVRWFTTYPLVPGLGNLIGQLGFNSSVFLWIAALEQGPWRDLAHHLFSGFLIAALFASIVPAAVRIFRGSDPRRIDWFFTLLFIPAAIWAATGKIVGTNTDLPTSVVCLVGVAVLFRALDEEFSPPGTSDFRRTSLVIAMVLFSLAVTFKLSSLVFASVGWAIACLKLWSVSRSAPSGKRQLGWALILSAAIVLPWIGRGLVLTGYPFFPSTALSIPVDWKVPAFEAQGQADVARSFARVPETTYEYAYGWNWLRPWFRELVREREGFLIPMFFVLAGCVAGIIRTAREKRSALPQWLWLLAPSLAGLFFWFLEAPAVRFGEPAIWTAGATLGTFAALHFLDQAWKIRIGLAGLLLMTAWAAHPRLLWGSHFHPSVGVRTFLRVPQAKLAQHQTASGLTIYVPVATNQCWDAPLPCSPYFKDGLHLRQPGKLEHGFALQEAGTAAKPK